MTAIEVESRPFLMISSATNTSVLLTSAEARVLLGSYSVLDASANRVSLRSNDGYECALVPATYGGGPAFLIER